MTEIEELERRAQKAAAAAREAQQALDAARAAEAAARMEPLKALVERAHDALCQWNHTDGCSWGYEQDAANPWACDAHSRWLRRYDEIINGSRSAPAVATIDQVEAIVAAIKDVKGKAATALHLIRSGRLTP